MSIRADSSSLITGAVVVGVPGLGVLAEAVPSTGEHGAGYLYASLEFPADAGKEVRGLITTWPTLGTLTAFEDSSFEYDGASDTFAFQMYVDGVAVGSPVEVELEIAAAGDAVFSLSAAVPVSFDADFSAEGADASLILAAEIPVSASVALSVDGAAAADATLSLSAEVPVSIAAFAAVELWASLHATVPVSLAAELSVTEPTRFSMLATAPVEMAAALRVTGGHRRHPLPMR